MPLAGGSTTLTPWFVSFFGKSEPEHFSPGQLETVRSQAAYGKTDAVFILEDRQMLRTILTIGVMALLGLVALKLVFGVMPFLVGLLLFVVGLAIKVALVGGAIYLVVRIASPDTARRLKAKFTGQLY